LPKISARSTITREEEVNKNPSAGKNKRRQSTECPNPPVFSKGKRNGMGF